MSRNPAPRLPALFRMLSQRAYRDMLEQVVAAGFDDIRLPHWPVLQWPGPEGERPSALAARAGTSKQAINHVLRDLERLGYLELRPDPDDSRARLVTTTERGRALVEAMFTAAAAAERAFESVLTEDQSRDLKATLNLLWRSDVSVARSPTEVSTKIAPSQAA